MAFLSLHVSSTQPLCVVMVAMVTKQAVWCDWPLNSSQRIRADVEGDGQRPCLIRTQIRKGTGSPRVHCPPAPPSPLLPSISHGLPLFTHVFDYSVVFPYHSVLPALMSTLLFYSRSLVCLNERLASHTHARTRERERASTSQALSALNQRLDLDARHFLVC